MAVQNSIGGGSFIYPQLTGVKFLNAFGSNLSTGDNDLYTVPTGKKALVCSAGRAYNQSGGNIIELEQQLLHLQPSLPHH
jgi:hypothetical protein